MSTDEALFFPLARAFALSVAATLREVGKVKGMSYADRELSEALARSANQP